MGVARFCLEIVADSLHLDSSIHGAAAVALPALAGATHPALGLRLLDLSTAVLEAPEGECYEALSASRSVYFGGRGKALVFELRADMVQGDDSGLEATFTASGAEPLPLWLMALAAPASALPPGSGGAAILLASACVDLRGEILRAASPKQSALGGYAYVPFRKCSLQLTPVRDAHCAFTLDCYLRVYAGSQQQLSGGELLVEPRAVMRPKAPRPVASAETQTAAELERPHEARPLVQPAVSAATALAAEAASDVASNSRFGASCTAVAMADLVAACTGRTPLSGAAPAAPAAPERAPLRGGLRRSTRAACTSDDAVFPPALCLGPLSACPFACHTGPFNAARSPAPLAPPAPPKASAPPTPATPLVPPNASAPDGDSRPAMARAACSLPLVSELLRELWQLRAVEQLLEPVVARG